MVKIRKTSKIDKVAIKICLFNIKCSLKTRHQLVLVFHIKITVVNALMFYIWDKNGQKSEKIAIFSNKLIYANL